MGIHWTRNYHYRTALVWTGAPRSCSEASYSPRYRSCYHHDWTALVRPGAIGPRPAREAPDPPRHRPRHHYYWPVLVRPRATCPLPEKLKLKRQIGLYHKEL